MTEQTHERSLDELARGLASGTLSRGKALKLMGAALLGGTLASLGIREAAADPLGCKRNATRRKENPLEMRDLQPRCKFLQRLTAHS